MLTYDFKPRNFPNQKWESPKRISPALLSSLTVWQADSHLGERQKFIPCLAARNLVTSSQGMLVTTWKVDSAAALQLLIWQVPVQRVCFYLRISQHCNTLVASASWWDSGKFSVKRSHPVEDANSYAKEPDYKVPISCSCWSCSTCHNCCKLGFNSVAIWPWYSCTTVLQKWLHMVQSDGSR